MNDVPTPGSPDAVAEGCACPAMDNARGAGIRCSDGTVLHWRNENCPLHRPHVCDAFENAVGAIGQVN